MFLLGYGATIFYVYTDGNSIAQSIEVFEPFSYMNNAMIFASIGFISMWCSYHSQSVVNLARSFIDLITLNGRILKYELYPSWTIIYLIFFSSLVFKLILISLGVYGVISTLQADEIEFPFLNIINLLSSAGSGALFFLYLYSIKTGKKIGLSVFFFVIDFFFSILTGYKGAIVISVLVISIAYYLLNGRIKYVYLFLTILTLQFAYFVVSPYRIYIQRNSNFNGTSLFGIVDSFIKSNQMVYVNDEKQSDNLAILKRFNFIPEIVKFQEYMAIKGLRTDDPDFLNMTLIAPIQVFIPRIFWAEKPRADLGRVWVNQKVFGRDFNSSAAFGPVGFLYLTGGLLAIVIGFILVGFFLQIVNLLLISDFWGGKLMGLALLFNSINLEAQFNYYIISFLQTMLLAVLFQYFLFKSSK
jgi:hypothetical protein